MIELRDQMNRTIRLANTPKRIVSLVPSQTELLYYLGCDDQVVGITKFCIHPNEWFRNKTRVGGTKNVSFDKLAALKPDLIIANKEENSKEDLDRLMADYPVYMSDIFNVEDACEMIEDVGEMVGRHAAAIELASIVQADFKSLPQLSGTVLYFIWSKPYMVVGPNTFIGHIIQRLGFTNLISDPEQRYQEITKEEISQLNPDHILLSSEPFPFKDEHLEEFREFTNAKVHLVDGEMFSWYGSRMLLMRAYFERLEIGQ
ncbi:MAG: ABC transporter substrate-binding protein [Crocinitomix sp.]|nr:ABC transporter substrate-binding protein [Crocinitomix sp.]